jgi:SAM-dependent methyltransferase
MIVDDVDSCAIVRILYHALLDRDPDPEGFAHFISLLDRGYKTLHEVTLDFVNSAEFVDKHRGAVPLRNKLLYDGYSPEDVMAFTEFGPPPSEAGKGYFSRLRSGFFSKYCRGELVLDVGFEGYANSEHRASLPGAIGVDVGYPGYDGLHLPWPDCSVDCVFSSHCLEHIQFYEEVIRDWHRVLKVGGYIVCMVPSRDLYEKKRFPPSRYNIDHKRFYIASRLAASFEEALEPNSFRIRHLHENDCDYDYSIGPDRHAVGCYEIEIVVEKIAKPAWVLE